MDFFVFFAATAINAFVESVKVTTFLGCAAYECGKSARRIHEEGKAWVDAQVEDFLAKSTAPVSTLAIAPAIGMDDNPWSAVTLTPAVPTATILPFPCAIRALPPVAIAGYLAPAEDAATPVTVESAPPMANFSDQGIRQLRKFAKEAGIPRYSRKSKAQLIADLTAIHTQAA